MPNKRYWSVFITVVILIFLGKNIYDHWQDLGTISLGLQSWVFLITAILVTLLAHCWAGYIWFYTLKFLHQNLSLAQVLPTYLKTNVAKYLPGNIWHYYGRVLAVTKCGGSTAAAAVSVLLEPLLMAAAALTISMFALPKSLWGLSLLGLGGILIALHPIALNALLCLLPKIKAIVNSIQAEPLDPQINPPRPAIQPLSLEIITKYPTFLFLAEIGFLQLRFCGFCLVFAAIAPLPIQDLQFLFSAFSFGWVAGLVVPVPAGLGVFESTILILLQPQFPPAIILSVVALFRIVSILAEIGGAGLGLGYDRQFLHPPKT